jgi:hypothetical protein
VKHGRHVLGDSQHSTQRFGELSGQSRVTVADDLLRESKPFEYVLEVELGHSFGRDGLVAWDEDGCLSAVVVGDREYGIEPIREWQLNDEVHCNRLERHRLWIREDRCKRGFPGLCVDLVPLTVRASPYIVVNFLSHAGPPVVTFGEGRGARYPWVTVSREIVVVMDYLPPICEVSRHHPSSFLPPYSVDLS